MNDKLVCRICGKEVSGEKDLCPECEELLDKLPQNEPDEPDVADEAAEDSTPDTEEKSYEDPMSKSRWLWYVIPLVSVIIVFAAFIAVPKIFKNDSDSSSGEASSQAADDSDEAAESTGDSSAAEESSQAAENSAAESEDESSYSSGYTETPTEPADGKPGGKYIFSKAFSGDNEVDLSPDFDIKNFYFHFNGDGTGVYSNPAGAEQIAWKDGSLSTDSGLEAKYTLDGDQLTVTDGDMKLVMIHESVYEDTREKPDGKYVFSEGYVDGEKTDNDAITAENTYMIFNSDGTGEASGSNGVSSFTWENGKIYYEGNRENDASYVLHGDELKLYEITSTVIMVKAKD